MPAATLEQLQVVAEPETHRVAEGILRDLTGNTVAAALGRLGVAHFDPASVAEYKAQKVAEHEEAAAKLEAEIESFRGKVLTRYRRIRGCSALFVFLFGLCMGVLCTAELSSAIPLAVAATLIWHFSGVSLIQRLGREEARKTERQLLDRAEHTPRVEWQVVSYADYKGRVPTQVRALADEIAAEAPGAKFLVHALVRTREVSTDALRNTMNDVFDPFLEARDESGSFIWCVWDEEYRIATRDA